MNQGLPGLKNSPWNHQSQAGPGWLAPRGHWSRRKRESHYVSYLNTQVTSLRTQHCKRHRESQTVTLIATMIFLYRMF